MGNFKQSFLAGLFSIITIGILTFLTYKTELGIFLLASISTFAQGVRYGAKMGMNFSTLDGDAFENSSTRYGFAAGIFAEIPLGSAFQFQPELLYSGQGIKPNTGPEGNFGFDVNSFSHPMRSIVLTKFLPYDEYNQEVLINISNDMPCLSGLKKLKIKQ